MKKLALLTLSVIGTIASAQLPYVEGFETLTGYTPDVNVIDNLGDYFARMNTACASVPDPCAVNFTEGYSGWIGMYYWAGEDHDDPDVGGAGVATLCITLDPIDISGNTSNRVEIAAYFAADDVSNAYDPSSDNVTVSYAVDGGAAQNAHFFSYYTPNGGASEFLAYDDNNNGVIDAGETTILTETFARFARTVTASGNSLVITVCAHSNSSSEEWAIDHIEVSSSLLPVELIDFSIQVQEQDVLVQWSTATEINNDYFVIERSANGRTFQDIALVEGNGTTSEVQQYTYLDQEAPSSEYLYYRLRQVDFDGTSDLSEVKVIQTNASAIEIRLHPNPTRDQIQIEHTSGEFIQTINIYDSTGHLLKTSDSETSVLDLSEYDGGIYVINVRSKTTNSWHKVIKM